MEALDNKFDRMNEFQKNMILEFAGIMNIDDVETSIFYLEMSNFNINMAIENFLKRGQMENKSNGDKISSPFKNEQPNEEIKEQNDLNFHQNQNGDAQSASLFIGNQHFQGVINEYKKYLEFREKKKINSSGVSLLDKIKGVTTSGEMFLKELHNKNGKFETFNFIKGNFLQNLENSFKKNKKNLIVFIYIPTQFFQETELKVIKYKPLIDYVNKNFDIMGLLATSDEAVKVLTQYIKSKDWPCFACFRLNLFEKPQMIDNIVKLHVLQIFNNIKTISKRIENLEVYKNHLEGVLNSLKFIEDEENLIRKHAEPKKPKSENEKKLDKEKEKEREAKKKAYQERKALQIEQTKKKADEDRILRQLQEEEYKEAEKLMIEQEHLRQKEDELKIQKELEEKQKQVEEKEFLQQEKIQKAKKLLELPSEPFETELNIITILFRLPNGAKISRRFRFSEKVEVIFDFIECQEDVGFESSNKFTIIRTMPFLSLLEKKNYKIEEAFDGSDQEVLHVKEID